MVFVLSLHALADATISMETRQVPVNRGGEDGGTVSLRFYSDLPSIPYISVADFQQLMLPGTMIEVSKTGESEYLLRGPYANATVNIASEQFHQPGHSCRRRIPVHSDRPSARDTSDEARGEPAPQPTGIPYL